MNRDKQIEEMPLTEVDILANDINQHCADLAETYCGDTNCVACLAHALSTKGYRKVDSVTFMGGIVEQLRAEVALEVIGEVEKIIDKFYNKHIFDSDLEDTEIEAVMDFSGDISYDIYGLKEKYTEGNDG